MSELNKLKLKRGTIKGQLKRVRNYIESVDQNNLTNLVLGQLRIRLDRAEPLLSQFEDVQCDIDILSSESQKQGENLLELEDTERDDFEKQYFDLISYLKLLLNRDDEQSSKSSSKGSRHSVIRVDGGLAPTHQPARQAIKLPDLKLPTFNGSYEKWLEFRDAFQAIVHNNLVLSGVEKFYYLKSYLENEPFQTIANLQVTNDNYAVAWALLSDRYENKKLIVHNYVKTLFECPNILKESHADLRKLYDLFNKNLRSLQSLGQDTDSWDILIVYLLTSKFDVVTRREWESYPIKSGELPKLRDVNAFLKSKCELLEKLETTKKDSYLKPDGKGKQIKSYHALPTVGKFSCYYCKKNHAIYRCFAFKNLSVKARIAAVNKLKLCTNCFNPDHLKNCPNTSYCRICGEKHNSLLHLDEMTVENHHRRPPSDLEVGGSNFPPLKTSTAGHAWNNSSTLSVLATANIKVCDDEGVVYVVRALLDPGSQSNFISEGLVDKLGLQKYTVKFQIMGVGENVSTTANSKVNVKIMSNINDYSEVISCLVIPKITQGVPTVSFDISDWNIPQNLRLADENFNIQKDIDILLGVDVFYRTLLMKQIRIRGMPTLQKTRFGWILGGYFDSSSNISNTQVTACLSLDQTIDEKLTRFWELEECSNEQPVLSNSEQLCEEHFLQNYSRDSDGRFVVKFPFKDNIASLGQSKSIALKRLMLLERRLIKNDSLKKDYVEFLEEYKDLGHMTKIEGFSVDVIDTKPCYYLPHHPVIKESSLTTKVRVVFDASAKSDTGLSLNDVQHAGPTIQRDLLSIVLRFRIYPYVLNADISKMYRQILIDPNERCFQRILWKSPDDPRAEIECYELNTVTYGCASSPFLAVRSLKQLALDFQAEYPEASEAILNCFYLDDLLTGAFSSSKLLQIQREISFILASGGFQLRKWLSNKPNLLNQFQVHNNLSSSILHLGEDDQNKTLGVFWNAFSDTIHYSINHFKFEGEISKRTVLSVISQIFDPLGLLGPIVVVAKLFMQLLWQEHLAWDEQLPSYLHNKWLEFCKNLQFLNQVSIPRHVLSNKWEIVHIHGFADASERAYGGCVYIVGLTNSGEHNSSSLLLSKSRVAPIKKISLPRLELCAAVLTCKLVEKVKESLKINFHRVLYWTDSTITLCWIKGCPSRWKTFVANRVTEIQNMSRQCDWFHVKSEENPADCLSRGIPAESLLHFNLWWNGPTRLFFNYDFDSHCVREVPQDLPEQRVISHSTCVQEIPDFEFSKYSSLVNLQRILAYCLRFIQRLKNNNVPVGPLTTAELNDALNKLVKMSQIQSFTKDYYLLNFKRSLSNSSSLLCLKPYCDETGLIRVGGRIQNADVPEEQKHPALLHNKHYLTKLIMNHIHVKLLHCGPQQLLYATRERFWPISGRRIARTILKGCVHCFKSNPTSVSYSMGNLPNYRVSGYQPVFTNTGVDYAGPLSIRDKKCRNPRILKGYICIFVCMNTKCVHLEVVSDLTSQAFLAVLKRFVARRGKPLHIYSDNGTNFVGANSILQKFFRSNFDKVVTELSAEGISWHFMPPRAPNFGGLWEAGVKSIKFHLKRVVGDASLTYEDLSTVLIQIEGVINSRPLTPLSSDPQDMTPLSPAHFLIGKSLIFVPEQDYTRVAENRLRKFQHLQQMVQHFWKRWNKEYISELQLRVKWKKDFSNLLKVGSLVIIKEDNVPVCKWKIGRVIELHNGSDNVTRVVSVQCSDHSVCKRAVTKLCVLPIEEKC